MAPAVVPVARTRTTRNGSRLPAATLVRMTAAPDSTVAMDYMALADEIAKEGI